MFVKIHMQRNLQNNFMQSSFFKATAIPEGRILTAIT